jgi:hypothetical protein
MPEFRARPLVVTAEQFFYNRPWPSNVRKSDGQYCVCENAVGQHVILAEGDWIVNDPRIGVQVYDSRKFAEAYEPLPSTVLDLEADVSPGASGAD